MKRAWIAILILSFAAGTAAAQAVPQIKKDVEYAVHDGVLLVPQPQSLTPEK